MCVHKCNYREATTGAEMPLKQQVLHKIKCCSLNCSCAMFTALVDHKMSVYSVTSSDLKSAAYVMAARTHFVWYCK